MLDKPVCGKYTQEYKLEVVCQVKGNPPKPCCWPDRSSPVMASSQAMKQSGLDLNLSTKKTRKQELLATAL